MSDGRRTGLWGWLNGWSEGGTRWRLSDYRMNRVGCGVVAFLVTFAVAFAVAWLVAQR